MKLVFIFGNAAVGKMTVGQELMKITDLRLFDNHMTIVWHFDLQESWDYFSHIEIVLSRVLVQNLCEVAIVCDCT